MFINFSNHPISTFPPEQLKAAQVYGKLVDMPFPPVPANASKEEVEKLAKESVAKILACHPVAVMCQGEFTLVYAVVSRLKAAGITCVSACSNRNSREIVHEDGSVTKESVFVFSQFREY